MCKPLAASLDGIPSSEAEPLHVSLYRSLADAELCRKISCLETHARASVFDSRVPRARVHFEAPLLVATRTHDRRAAPPIQCCCRMIEARCRVGNGRFKLNLGHRKRRM